MTTKRKSPTKMQGFSKHLYSTQAMKLWRKKVYFPSFYYNIPLHSLLEIPTNTEVTLQKLPPWPCKFLNSLQRKQSFALRSPETACTLSSLPTVCPARPPSPVASEDHHHPHLVPTGTSLGCHNLHPHRESGCCRHHEEGSFSYEINRKSTQITKIHCTRGEIQVLGHCAASSAEVKKNQRAAGHTTFLGNY